MTYVLIPSEQGKYSNHGNKRNSSESKGLNPFGTGKVFKQPAPVSYEAGYMS